MADATERTTRIISMGRVTIPREVRRVLGVPGGDSIVFRQEGAAVTVSAAMRRTLTELLAGFDPLRHLHEPNERPWDEAPKGRESI